MEESVELGRTTWAPERWERNVLLVAPRSRDHEFDCCVELSTPDDPARLNVWSLDLTISPAERMAAWAARCDGSPAHFRIVSARHYPTDGTNSRARELGFDPGPEVSELDDPKNLTRIGVELTEALSAWENDGKEAVVCFHSLTSLLQHVPTERAYRFLHPFTNTVREFDARAHYHVNPRAHDEQEVERLAGLFDGVWDPRVD